MQITLQFGTNASSATWLSIFEQNTSGTTYNWPNLEPMQVAFFFLAEEITQVKEAIPWVRCASGNVYKWLGLGYKPPPPDLCVNCEYVAAFAEAIYLPGLVYASLSLALHFIQRWVSNFSICFAITETLPSALWRFMSPINKVSSNKVYNVYSPSAQKKMNTNPKTSIVYQNYDTNHEAVEHPDLKGEC